MIACFPGSREKKGRRDPERSREREVDQFYKAGEKRGAERMRKTRMAFGLVVAVCAFGVVAAPALAFGKFYASIKGQTISEENPGTAKGRRSGTLKLGPYHIRVKSVSDKGKVISEESRIVLHGSPRVEVHSVDRTGRRLGHRRNPPRALRPGDGISFELFRTVGEGESEIRIVKPAKRNSAQLTASARSSFQSRAFR